MKLLVIMLATAFTLPVLAKQLGPRREIYELTNQIQTELQYTTATTEDFREVRRLLQNSLEILSGKSSGESRFKCVSRDNDGRSPFSLAVQDDNYNITKTILSFPTMEACEASVKEAVSFRGMTLMCSSRDNDGRSPFSIFNLNGAQISPLTLATSTYESCKKTLANAKDKRDFVILCASRDNDDRSPWTMVRIDKATKAVTKLPTTFSSYEECVNGL